jgi:hypothetical protein
MLNGLKVFGREPLRSPSFMRKEIQMTQNKTTGSIDSFLSEWTSAERVGDSGKLEDLLTDHPLVPAGTALAQAPDPGHQLTEVTP